jgi:hypothetical protein
MFLPHSCDIIEDLYVHSLSEVINIHIITIFNMSHYSSSVLLFLIVFVFYLLIIFNK